MANDVSTGQKLIERLEAWFKSYVVFPESIEDAALVIALYAVNSWIYQVWDSTPYLCISAATKGAAKTVQAELLTFVCKNGKMVPDPTQASALRELDARQGWATLTFDEAEKFNRENHPMRPFANTGYRKGQTLSRTAPGGVGIVEFKVYCPKVFALIGDVYSTLRDRCIVVTLQRATPGQLSGVKRYRWSDAGREASAIVPDIERFVASLPPDRLQLVEATHVSGRDEELWTPLFSTAHALGLDRATMERLTRVSADLTAAKSVAARRYTDVAQMEEQAQSVSYGEKALKDLRRVVREGETAIWSAVAVQRMRDLADGPWRMYKGDGLNPDRLADLLSPFGVTSKSVKREKKVQRGYQLRDLNAAAKK